MRDILSERLQRFKRIRLRKTWMVTVLLVLSLVVSLDVFWVLRQPGLTLAGDADCGILEHIHDEECQDCEIQEHIHSIECYSDDTADVETMLDWQEMFADYPYTGDLREDLVGIAKTQVGYSESSLNFMVDSNGVRQGYTRYGAWYGTPYRDWSAMFVSFCLSYAGADAEENPGNTGALSMAELWNNLGKYAPVGEYDPQYGDLVFFGNNTVGIVAEIQSISFSVIRGDIEGSVQSEVISLTDDSITGWGITVGSCIVEEEPEQPEETTESVTYPTEIDREQLLDITNGPALFIIEGSEPISSGASFYSLRNTRAITELLPYLEAHGGGYFFTLLNTNNEELPKDEDGNYVAEINTGYKMTISFTSPDGFLAGTYQYQVPNGLMVDGGEGDFVLTDGTNVGSWVVTDTGLITLYFNDHMNSRTDITISAVLGIHFPEQEEPIDFDGLISVKVEKPPPQEDPTVITKWGSQSETDQTKIAWTLRIDGHTDSQIPGNILTDQTALSDWSRPHNYTESDIAGGLSFGVSDAEGDWHSWHVPSDDPHLIWDESGWSYKIPKTVTCDYCGELELGNDGWIYLINYTSTPTPLNTAGKFDYENMVTIDGQTAWGWSNFTHGEISAQIKKDGSFISDAAGGAFLWEVQAVIPGRTEGNRAEYSWFISDETRLWDTNGDYVGHVQNDMNLSLVTATYNGTIIQIPRIQDATENDLFVWDNAWTATDNGISHTRTINILSRCRCTPETCHWGNCGEYWYKNDAGETIGTREFCQCWTETQNMTFTFVYKTTDLSVLEGYGTLGYQVNNHAQLYYIPDDPANPDDNEKSVRVSYDDASVLIPNLFKKELDKQFDGYTASYKVTVNEAKVNLTNGSPLTIHDVMTDTLAYISGSLIITTEDVNGNRTTLQQGTDFTVTYDGTGNQKDENGDSVHVLDIVILHPQPVMYILDYDTTLIMPDQLTSGIKYTNYASITLWGEEISDTSTEKVYAEFNIAAKSYKVEIFKTAANTGEPLGGATFGLYNETGGLISTEVTDFHGKLNFQTNIVKGIILREHQLYYMQELNPPTGYELDDTKYWICFCDEAGDNCEVCEEIIGDKNAARIPFEQVGKIAVKNELMKYEMPATGGPGIYPFILVGAIFIVIPLVYRFVLRRKQERRGVG